jgi:S-formylglutathione hydrolase FrmB
MPKLRFDCGLKDGLLSANRELHRKLESLRIAHEYEEFPGTHDWDYWDLHIQETLAFHARALGI